MTVPHKRTAVGIACVCLLAGSTRIVNAQTVANSFDELANKLKPGQTISIRDDEGRRIDGNLTEVSASSIRIMSGGVQQTLTQDHVREITQTRRNTSRGMAIGLAAGLAVGLLSAVSDHTPCPPDLCVGLAIGGMIGAGGMGTGIGAALGAGSTHQEVVYRAPSTGKKRSAWCRWFECPTGKQ